jgi:hypothetical protein
MLLDWQEPAPQLALENNTLEIVEKFDYLGSCFSTDGFNGEVSNRITKARNTFMRLTHLWRRRDISMRLKGRVYNATVRAVLLYGSETWSIRAADIQHLSVFEHRCLRSIARIWWEHRITNAEVRHRVLGPGNISQPLDTRIAQNQLRWLGHLLRMSSHRLPKRTLFAQPGELWKKPPGGQKMTWLRNMKTLTARLALVGPSRLPGWGPRDGDKIWLMTLANMAQNRNQWRSCCQFLS